MSEENNSVSEIAEIAPEELAEVQSQAEDFLETASQYVRENPWIALAGAAVVGGVIASLLRPKPRPTGMAAFRRLLDEGLSRLPTQKQVEEVAESSGIPCFFKQLSKRFHLS